jgi:hypothetical protein
MVKNFPKLPRNNLADKAKPAIVTKIVNQVTGRERSALVQPTGFGQADISIFPPGAWIAYD